MPATGKGAVGWGLKCVAEKSPAHATVTEQEQICKYRHWDIRAKLLNI